MIHTQYLKLNSLIRTVWERICLSAFCFQTIVIYGLSSGNNALEIEYNKYMNYYSVTSTSTLIYFFDTVSTSYGHSVSSNKWQVHEFQAKL
jgi:hypothetical protein